ncbi:uncharacterized protein LOC136081829 [Hydra vulgaris]|uniref:Uncharacterized protein LOC136081829 n=1 Tax=Hydra vulgaris TaxID=6087 RepID=A0ABM4C3J3_HYDVU
MADTAVSADESINEAISPLDNKELVICVTGYVYTEHNNKENSSVEEKHQKGTGLMNFIRTKSTRKVKFKDVKENSSNTNSSIKALPTYKSLDSLNDEPPRYEVVTGKPLQHGHVVLEQEIERHEEDNESESSAGSSRIRHLLNSNRLIRLVTFGMLFIVIILMLIGILKMKK